MRQAVGADPATLEFSEIVEHDGNKEFHFMKAIPIGSQDASLGVCEKYSVNCKIGFSLEKQSISDQTLWMCIKCEKVERKMK